ncbi:hypothetical protein Q7P35_004209 [Cladosporium inversicolor]
METRRKFLRRRRSPARFYGVAAIRHLIESRRNPRGTAIPDAIAATFVDPDLETCAASDGQVVGIEVWFWEMVVCASHAPRCDKSAGRVPFIMTAPSVLLYTIRPSGSWNGFEEPSEGLAQVSVTLSYGPSQQNGLAPF